MKIKDYRFWPVILTIVAALLALAAESLYFSDFEYNFKTRKFNKLLIDKENILEDCLERMKPILARGEPHGSTSETNVFSVARQNEITILEYFDGRLVAWSDDGFEVPLFLNESFLSRPIIFLQNGWFLTKKVEAGNEIIVGLLRINTDYGFENDIVRNGFVKDFRMPADVRLSADANASEYRIRNKAGEFLFCLAFPQEKINTFLIFIPLVLYSLTFILIFLLTHKLVKYLAASGRSRTAVFFSLMIFSGVYAFVLLTGRPSVIFETDLFSPYVLAPGPVIPSLGHLLLLTVLASGFSYFFYRYFPLNELKGRTRTQSYLILTLMFLVSSALFVIFNHTFTRLILNSNISFETYRILQLNAFSVAGFTAVSLLLLVAVLFVLKILQKCGKIEKAVIFSSIISSSLLIAGYYSHEPGRLLSLLIFYIAAVVIIWITVRNKMDYFNLTVLFSLVFGIFSVFFIIVHSEKRTDENIKIQLLSLSTGNDPVAEHYLLDIWPEMEADTMLGNMMDVDFFERSDFERISKYLLETYFSDYLGNFKFNIVPCSDDEPLRVGSENKVVDNCFAFFDERIKSDGHRLTGTQFYFLENQGGRSHYLGRIFFKRDNNITNGLFIELYSDINIFQPGYSELLFDKNYYGFARLKDYSFAKYINGEIVIKSGDFPYNNNDVDYIGTETDYSIFKSLKYRHILYKNGNITTIISRPLLTTGDVIISFAYLFTFIFLFSNLVLLIIRRPSLKGPWNLNFRQKLQMSFIGVLLFSFILIGVVVAYLSVNQFRTKHNENIKEKLNSVYVELENHLSLEKQLTPVWSDSSYISLGQLLIELSNIFNTDINLYGLDGFLIATSRPEIFNRNLKSTRMNDVARINLTSHAMSEYTQKEKIGSLEYISAYVPFISSDDRVLAYVNVPYFRIQSILTREISNLIVAVINFTLLLIVITMALAVIISGRLTSPLSMLSKGLASVRLGKNNEHLSYTGHDEIGELVKQYNRMVDEIQESAHKLANSEREYAWREMAKQIAHEIKNPLTPMKLNVQQLLKSWKDGIPEFDKKLEIFTANQIEYIDNLSSIATAFSSFAKMPGTNPVETDLLEQIRITLELFKNTNDVKFEVGWPHESKVFIYADREHLNGIFSNLIKNAIQSIPSGKEGMVKVITEVKGDKVVVAISDNGTGIPNELKRRMFTPNFTTKSSGMGLGLSIVKRYAENANGRIWFESEADKGTIFYVEFPLKYTVESPHAT